MNEYVIAVLEREIRKIEKSYGEVSACFLANRQKTCKEFQQAINQLSNTEVIASGKCKIWTHYDKTEEVYLEKDKHTRYFIDDIIKSKYNEQEIIIKIEVVK